MATYNVGKGTKGKVWVNNQEDPVARRVSFESSTDRDKIFAIGQETPVAIVTGTTEYTGRYERYFAPDQMIVGGTGMTLAQLCGAAGDHPGNVSMTISPQPNQTFYLSDVKFYNYALEVTPDDVVVETAELEIANVSQAVGA